MDEETIANETIAAILANAEQTKVTKVWSQWELDHALRGNKEFCIERMTRIYLDHDRGFEKLCEMLKIDNEDIRTLDIDFNWLDYKQNLIQLLKVNKSIVNLHLAISDEMKPEDINNIMDVIMEQKTIKRLTFTRTVFHFNTISIPQFAELLLASKIPNHVTLAIKIKTGNPQSEEEWPSPHFEDSDLPVLLDLVTVTKCAKLIIWAQQDFNLDIKILADYILDGKAPLLTALTLHGVTPASDWIQILDRTRTLKTFKIDCIRSRNIGDLESEYFRALENCQVRVLELTSLAGFKRNKNFYHCVAQALKNNKFVEKLILTACDSYLHADQNDGEDIVDLLKENDRINFLEIFIYNYEHHSNIGWSGASTPLGSALVKVIETNQSVIGINTTSEVIGATDFHELKEFMQRNQKSLNSAVYNVISLTYSLARDKKTLQRFPTEVWSIIFSWVRIPGVSLNFAEIFTSVLNDTTVRRVIPRKKLRAFNDKSQFKQRK